MQYKNRDIDIDISRSDRFRGMTAIISMIVISAVALAISISISLLSVDNVRNSLKVKRSLETLKIAEACSEDALWRLNQDSTYSGVSYLDVFGGECDVSITGAGSQKTIDVVGRTFSPNHTKRLRLNVLVLGNSINILSWNEVE